MMIDSVMDYLHKFYFYHCKTMLHINKKNEKKKNSEQFQNSIRKLQKQRLIATAHCFFHYYCRKSLLF